MAHQLRILVAIPLGGDAMARAGPHRGEPRWERAKDVAAFEPTLDAFAEAVARAGGEIAVDVIKAKPRAVKETH